jgi:acid phosphatase type 7
MVQSKNNIVLHSYKYKYHLTPRSMTCNEGTLHKHGVLKSARLILFCSVALLLVPRWQITEKTFFSNRGNVVLMKESDPYRHTSPHTLPTILSVVDPDTGDYINALENPLYEILKESYFINDASHSHSIQILKNGIFVDQPDRPLENIPHPISAMIAPALALDRDYIAMRDPVQLQWTRGRDLEGSDYIADNDSVLIVSCDKQVLEAATLRQAKATSRKHMHLAQPQTQRLSLIGDEADVWFFPSFPILRRDTCRFSLYKKLETMAPENPPYFLLTAWKDLHFVDSKTAPTAIHIAFGDDIAEMVIQFKSGDIVGVPIVEYGVDGLHHNVTGISHTYTAEDMCQEPATTREPGKFQEPGRLYVVRLQGLAPSTTYQYRVGVYAQNRIPIQWSDTFSFVSAPVVKADSDPFVFLVYGDQGCPARGWGDGGLWTAAMTVRELDGLSGIPIRAVHHFGDLSYAVGVAHIWDEWLNMISSFAPRVPLMIGVGNHEYDHTSGGIGKDPSLVNSSAGYHPTWGNFGRDSGGECGVPTSNHFTMPKSNGSVGVFWYSYNMASVHTIMLSTEHDLAPGSVQHQWLEQDLKAIDRRLTPWVVVEIHRPLYEAERDIWDYAVALALRAELEDLLIKYRVDLVLGGHYHSYVRTCQGLYKQKCNKGGPLHITVGSAGAHLNNNTLYENGWTEKFLQATFGYGWITVMNATALHFEFVKAGSDQDPDAGSVLDDVWLVKQLCR